MIKSLDIKNLHSHKESHLEFREGVNVIIGASDAGKSAIIRAFNWAAENRPLGDSIHSTWGGETVVNIVTDTAEIERAKYKRDQYTLSGIETPFKAFGTKVPEEIRQALNLDPINTQFQADPHFLFSKSPGEAAVFFNRIANLEILDKARNNIEKTINSIEADIKYNKKQLDVKTQELNEFEYLEKLEIELEVIEGLEEERNTNSSKISKLETSINTLREIESKLELLKEKITAEEEVDIVLQWITTFEGRKKEIESFTDLLFEINACESDIRLKSKILLAEASVNKVIELIEEEQKNKTIIEEFEKFLYNIKNTIKKLIMLEKELADMEKTFEKEMPERCPLCETLLKPKS